MDATPMVPPVALIDRPVGPAPRVRDARDAGRTRPI